MAGGGADVCTNDGHYVRRSYTRRASRIADRQLGLVRRSQLVDAGVPIHVVDQWVRRGRLRPVHRSVYALGHGVVPFDARCLAACLAIGGDAMVTGAAAGYLRGVERRRPDVIEVTTTRNVRARLDGVRVIRTRTSIRRERDRRGPIPIASVARMLVDRAETATATEVADIMHECEFRGLFNLRAVERCAERSRARRGLGPRRIRFAIHLQRTGSAGMQDASERRVLGRLLDRGAPMPEITPAIELPDGRVIRPDLLWNGLGIAAEINGRRSHGRARTRVRDEWKAGQLEEMGVDTYSIREGRTEADIEVLVRALSVRLADQAPSSARARSRAASTLRA